LSNPLSKLQCHTLPGDFFLSAISETQLAIESRLSDQLFFSVFSLGSGSLLHEAPARLLSPWYSLYGIAQDHLTLQYFESRKNPDLVKWYGYDWHKDSLLRELPAALPQTPRVSSPTYYAENNPDFRLFKQLISEELVLGCEYQEVNNHLIISYYVKEQNHLTRHLLVLTDGKAVYSDVQDKELKGFAPGSFFTFQNHLIFVRNKRELNIYEI
jgi:hypothetical protein